jgi:DMSO/TMAO reductase YedYZ molybdopterin-dependent catalytic subunit
MSKPDSRRTFLARALLVASTPVLGACQKLSETPWFADALLSFGENLSQGAMELVGRKAMAQEFPASAISPTFRSNGTAMPASLAYQRLAQGGFSEYRLRVDGLVEAPREFTLADLKAMPSRSQITRHDCVEGWSAIGKWQGTRLSALLDAVRPRPGARFVVLHCADMMDDGAQYYESIDLDDARHEQTILAWALNDAPLPIENGAPLRLRVERQLGYKHAKYVMRLQIVDSFARIAGGKGGYWEDRGYQWFAGI